MMEKLNRIQKHHNLNTVYRNGAPGPGGAYHEYLVFFGDVHAEEEQEGRVIQFQKGPRKDPESISGVLDVDLLEIVRDRLRVFQTGKFACKENACALTHIEEALLWMNKRTEDRAERQVLGTMNK